MLFAACGECGLRVWDMEQQREHRGTCNEIYALDVSFAPDGRFLLASGQLVEIGTWQVHHDFPGYSSDFSPDGRLITTLEELNSVRVWDRETKRLLYTIS